MKSLSNVIKANAIQYEDAKKLIDSNEKADVFMQKYLDQINAKYNTTEKYKENRLDQSGFVEGITAIPVSEIEPNTIFNLEELKQEQDEIRNKIEEETKIILQEAKNEVVRLMEKGKQEAEAKKQEILNDARQKGYQEGQLKSEKELECLRAQLLEEREQIKLAYEKQVEDLEPAFVGLTVSLVKKLTGILMEDRKEIIFYLIEQALSGIDGKRSFIIHVSHDDYELVNSKKAEILWKLKEGTLIEIVEDGILARAQCLIETDSRVIDCSLDVQLKGLISDLKLMAGIRDKEMKSDMEMSEDFY